MKRCAGVEGRPPCGKEIRRVQTYCEDCRDLNRKLQKRAHNRSAYVEHRAERQEQSRARHQAEREKEDRRIAWRYVSWLLGEAEKEQERVRSWRDTAEADLPSHLVRSPEPKAYLRARGPRRERIKAMVPALVEERLQRAEAKNRKQLKDRAKAEADAEAQRNARPRWSDMGPGKPPSRGPARRAAVEQSRSALRK